MSEKVDYYVLQTVIGELSDASPEQLAAIFAEELTVGIDGGAVRAGFIQAGHIGLRSYRG